MLRRMVRRIDLALLPSEAEAIPADCYVVVDVLRATTTIAVLFDRGLRDLVAVDDIDAARARAATEGRLLFGEVGGLTPAGFDHGNSPVEASGLDLRGRRAVLFTTNGTRALCAVAGRGAVFAGALVNRAAIVDAASAFDRVCFVCAGTEEGRRFALEDFAAAAALVQGLARAHPGAETGDAAGLAMEVPGYEEWIAPSLPQRVRGRSTRFLAGSEHGRALARIGLAADINVAAQDDVSRAVPRVVEAGPGWARIEERSRH
ncbi:MAG: 2-phosphosulfolactate phosphatase [Dehalococcoidia bacterium]